MHTAYFKAIDSNGVNLLQKSEWSNYLKIRNTYISEEQAMQSFDSIDENKVSFRRRNLFNILWISGATSEKSSSMEEMYMVQKIYEQCS